MPAKPTRTDDMPTIASCTVTNTHNVNASTMRQSCRQVRHQLQALLGIIEAEAG